MDFTSQTAPPTVKPPAPSHSNAPAIAIPQPGMPWTGSSLLAAMRASVRPGGVPDELETDELAGAIARSIWTVDGTPWDTAAISGFCGASTCTLDLAGSRHDRDGEDLWTLQVDRRSGAIAILVAEVRSLPPALVNEIDRLVRSLMPAIDDAQLTMASARWLPPPSEPGRFALSYRSGGEEGSCALEITVDVTRKAIIEDAASGC